MKYLIGVDIGTTGIKTGLFGEDGSMAAHAFRKTNLFCPTPGIVEQNPDEFYEEACLAIKEMLNTSSVNVRDIKALSIDGQMAGIMGIDEDWNAVTHYDSWLDSRCNKYIEYIHKNYGDRVLALSGLPTASSHAAKIMWWKNEKNEIYKRIAKFIQPSVYVAGKMAGLKAKDAFTDHTYLHFSALYDAQKSQWSDELCTGIGVPRELLPDIVLPWKVVGGTTDEMTRKSGIISGTPVVAGAGDQAAGFLGAGIVKPGMIVDVAGTASLIACCVDKFIPDIKFKTLIFPKGVIGNLWYPHSYIGGGGLCLRWFRENMDQAEEKEKYYEAMNDAARSVSPGSEKLFFVPHLGGRNFPYDSKVRGLWAGFGWGHTKEHFYRSIMESIAYEYHYFMKIEKELFDKQQFKEVCVIGGGARSKLFSTIKANVLGLPYVELDREEVAIWGSAMIAGYGVSIIKNLKEKSIQSVQKFEPILPDLKLHEKYVKYAELYSDLFETMDDFYTRLSNLPDM